jgi:hypothetical protein
MPRPETDSDLELLANVESSGWHIVEVPERNEQPGWAFSVGLTHSFQHPEVVIFGLPETANREVLERVVQAVQAGASLREGSVTETILPGLRCELRPVSQVWHELLLGYAIWFYGGADFAAVQFLWPDTAGKLPGDPDFDTELAPLQPLFERDSAREAGAEALLHSLDRR